MPLIQFKKSFPHAIRRLLQTTALCLASGSMVAFPARSAEKIYLDYAPFGRVISTESLATFAEDGTINDELAPYLNGMSPQGQQEFQQLLESVCK